MLKRIFLFFIFNFLFVIYSYSAFEEKPVGAKPQSLGCSYTARAGDIYSIFYNPAGLRLLENPEIMFSQTTLFNISELKLQTFAFSIPTLKLGSFGLGYKNFGFSDYKENSIYLTNSFHLGKGIYFGFNLKKMGLKLEEYGSSSFTGIDVGLLGNISTKFSFGFSFSNINNPHIGSSTESPQKTFKIGTFYSPSEEVSFSFDLWNPGESGGEFRFGSNINVLQFLSLRFGLKTNPNMFSFGFGTFFKNFELSYSYLTHPYLDGQHQFSISYIFSKKEKELEEVSYPETEETVEERPAPEEVEEEVQTEKYNLNMVSYREMLKLGIDKKTARRIIAYRTSKGGFSSIGELREVKGMDKKLFRKLRNLFYVEEERETAE